MLKLIATIALSMFAVSASNDEPPAQDSEISGLARRLLGEENNKEWQKDDHKWSNYNQEYNLGDRYDERNEVHGNEWEKYDRKPDYYDQKQRGWNKDYKQNYEPNYGSYWANEGGNPGDNDDNLRLIDPEARSDDDTNMALSSRYGHGYYKDSYVRNYHGRYWSTESGAPETADKTDNSRLIDPEATSDDDRDNDALSSRYGRYGRNNYYGYNRYYRNKYNNNYGRYWSTQGDGYLANKAGDTEINYDSNEQDIRNDIDLDNDNQVNIDIDAGDYNDIDVNNEINIDNNVDNDNKQYNRKKKYEDIKVDVELNKDDYKVGSNNDEEDIEIDVHIGDDFTK